MNRLPRLTLALLTPFVLAWSAAAHGQSCTNGNNIYHRQAAGQPISCSQQSCHDTDPKANKNKILNGQQASVIDSALDTVGDMSGLRSGLNLSSSDLDDLALYIWYRAGNQGCPAPAPAFTANPTSLAFGNVNTGATSASQSVTITNTGAATANSISRTNSNAAEFLASGTCTTVTSMAVNASCTLTVAYKPSAAGADTATYTLTSGSVSVAVNLDGTGVNPSAPNVSASPTSLSFGNVTTGTTSATQTITVSNTGTAAATNMSYPAAPAKFNKSGTCGSATLNAGANCTVVFSYSPTTATADNATYTITGGGATMNISLSGTGTAPASASLQASPASLAFGSVPVGSTSATQTLTISNTGGASASGIGIANGNAVRFPVSGNNCSSTLAAGASCTLNVAYAPASATTDNATITISYSGGSPIAVPLSGTGTAAPTPNLSASPSTLAFGNVQAGSSSAAQTVTVNNTGGAQATGVALANSNSAEFVVGSNTCGATVSAGASCTFSVVYTPSGAGADNASITISYAGGANVNVAMSGTGTAAAAPNVGVDNPPAHGSVVVGSTKDVTYTLTNAGTAAASGLAFSGLSGVWSSAGGTCGSSLAASASCTYVVRFAPTATGAASATLTVSYTGGAPIAIALSGTGTAAPTPNLAFDSPAPHGNVVVGSSKDVTYTISNGGGAAASNIVFGTLSGEWSKSGGTCGATLAAGASCTYVVRFTPADAGAESATLSLTYTGGAASTALSATGVASAPGAGQLSMPAAVTMPDQAVGTTGAAQTVTLSNVGAASVSVTSIASSNAGEFTIGTSTCATVSAGASCTFSVTFTPSAAGGRAATITVTSNGTGSPQTIAASGNGTGGAPPGGSTAMAIEYYHKDFDHYFITSIADEITKLDNGTFAGWARTGKSFKVSTAKSTGLDTVCRFFSTAFGLKSSHFYTNYAPECTVLKSNPNWQLESEEVFAIPSPDFDGNCPANTLPVYRMYNEGQGGAPNHRFTTDWNIRAEMLLKGWIPEGQGKIGVMMCAPQ